MRDFLKSVVRCWLAILLVIGLAIVYFLPLWFALYIALTITPKVLEDQNHKGEQYEHRTYPA